MDLANLIIEPSKLFAAVAGIAGFAALIWWLMRKRQNRIWLPTVRILELESRLLPRLVIQPPPLLAFICFLLAALIMTSFAMKPRRSLFTPFEPNRTRIHIFADYSPSVSAYLSEDSYSEQIVKLWRTLRDGGRVTVSSSHGVSFFEPKDETELKSQLSSLAFHRMGLKLGHAIKRQMEHLGDMDRLFIVSDRDQHSWSGLNWKYLLDEMDVQFVDLTGIGSNPHNIFINQAEFLSTPNSQNMEWDVEISRRNLTGVLDGKLSASFSGNELGSFAWSMPADKTRITVRVSWPVEKIATSNQDVSQPVVWTLFTQKKDQLILDDEYRSILRGVKQNVLLISEPTGELILEDPVNQLQVVLEILGFKVKRLDQLGGNTPKATEYPFWIVVGGNGTGIDRFCPRTIEDARLDKANILRYQEQKKPLPRIWLAPNQLDADYNELCRCYDRLMLSSSAGGNNSPGFCDHVKSRNQWVGLLPSVGASQIGGEVGNASNSLAFMQTDSGTGLQVLSYTIPLRPSVATNISHAQLPVLIKELMTWQGLLASDGSSGAIRWPREEDISVFWESETSPAKEKDSGSISNVPLGESLLIEELAANLPPRFKTSVDWSQSELPVKKDREDPLPWLKLGMIVIVFLMALEALVTLSQAFIKLVKARAALLLLFFLPILQPTPAKADIEASVLGYSNQIRFTSLAREVSHRTSLELKEEPDTYPVFDEAILDAPWLWAKRLSDLRTGSGELRHQLVSWLKRGGFLIIDGPASDLDLEKLVQNLGDSQSKAGWRAIPPDHELMRSFYLLDALPVCNQAGWQGYHFDGRLAIVQIPFGFLEYVTGTPGLMSQCVANLNKERSVRVFVNMLMVGLATDYKKDQIHLPEILKRLR